MPPGALTDYREAMGRSFIRAGKTGPAFESSLIRAMRSGQRLLVNDYEALADRQCPCGNSAANILVMAIGSRQFVELGGSAIAARAGFAADIVWRGLGPVDPILLRRIPGAGRIGI